VPLFPQIYVPPASEQSDPDGKIDSSVLDANTILYATVDNTPAALPVAASRLVGRKSTGDIDDLTATEVATVLGGVTYWLSPDVASNRPAASSVLAGGVYFATDTGEVSRSDGTTWTTLFGAQISDRALQTGELALPVSALNSAAVGLNDATLKLTYFTAVKSETIATVIYTVGTTSAGATPTLSRFGIWEASADGALTALVASTTNDTALFTGTGSQQRSKALTAPFSKVRNKRYAVGALVVTGATVPTIAGCTYQSISGVSSIGGTRIAGQAAAQSDLPATLAAGSVANTTSAGFFALVQ
jgi:hypothetical protein